jgi:hypothetical protein
MCPFVRALLMAKNPTIYAKGVHISGGDISRFDAAIGSRLA